MGKLFSSALDLANLDTPVDDPAFGRTLIYPKLGGVYMKSSLGEEFLVGPSGSDVNGACVQGVDTQAFVNDTSAKLELTGTVHWNDGNFAVSTAVDALQVFTAGRYLAIGQFGWTIPVSEAGARVSAQIRVNNVAVTPDAKMEGTVPSGLPGPTIQVMAMLNLVENDLISLWGNQSTGENRTPNASNWLLAQRVGSGPAGDSHADSDHDDAFHPLGGTTAINLLTNDLEVNGAFHALDLAEFDSVVTVNDRIEVVSAQFLHGTAGTPSAGNAAIYVKSDNQLYLKTPAGTEVEHMAVVSWPTGTEPSLTGIPDGTLWVEYSP